MIAVLYSIVPWIGVMAAGYAFGAIMIRDPDARRRLCLRIGLSATVLFLVAGGLAAVLRPNPDEGPALFQLLNQNKYPASQLFLLMTLGPTIALLPFAESLAGRGAPRGHGIRARAAVLLSPPHPADSRRGVRRLARA